MKTFITNRDKNRICVQVEPGNDIKKLVFVMHGLDGNKEEKQIRALAQAFINNDYTVVTWDAVHTFGESTGGLYEDATITNYYADLEDVIKWAATKPWYIEPFVLCGHSLGGISTALYAQTYPEKIKALAPIATVVNGPLRMETKVDVAEDWKRTGYLTTQRSNGGTKTLKWSHMEDNMRYDITERASELIMPVLLVVGLNDQQTPPSHQQVFYDSLSSQKELHVIDGAEHTFARPHERDELRQIVSNWLTTTVK